MRALLWLVGLALLLTGCASEKGIIDKEDISLIPDIGRRRPIRALKSW